MIICLFEHDETDFRGNGLGPLSDAVSCTVTRNLETGVYELDMIYPTDGPLFDQVRIGSVITAKPAPQKRAQIFDVRSIIKTGDGTAEIIASHVSYRLNGIPIGYLSGNGVGEIMDDFKTAELLEMPSPFTYTTTGRPHTEAWENELPRSAMEVLLGDENSLVSVFGGEVDFDRFEVMLLDQIGEDRHVTLRYGKDLTDISDDTEGGLPNGVLPYWHKDDVATVIPAYTTPIRGRWNDFFEIVDMTSDFDSPPTAAQLKTAAEAQAAALILQTRSITFNAVDLDSDADRVWIGDTVGVSWPMLKIRTKARVIETVYNVLADRYDSVTAGKSQDGLAGTIAGNMSAQSTALADSLRGIITTKSITLTSSYSINAGQAKGTTPAENVDIYGGYYPLEVIRMRASNNNISFAEARLNRSSSETTVTFGARNNSTSNLTGVTIRAIILYIKNEFAITL